MAKVPGVNPVQFANLEEYVQFLDWQRGQGIRCPVLFLQQTFDAQGQVVYKTRPSPTDLQGGLPPTLPYANPSPTEIQNMPPSVHGQNQQQTLSTFQYQSQPQTFPVQPPNSYLNPNPTLLVDATQDDYPYNTNSYPSFDETSYYVGTDTPLDKLNRVQESQKISPNPMDENWGGADFTQKLVDQGYYKDNEVSIAVA